jgi:hypothetical protein
VSRAGGSWGGVDCAARYSRGNGSKVNIMAGFPAWAACAHARAINAPCPK